jgi:hypothetical protein
MQTSPTAAERLRFFASRGCAYRHHEQRSTPVSGGYIRCIGQLFPRHTQSLVTLVISVSPSYIAAKIYTYMHHESSLLEDWQSCCTSRYWTATTQAIVHSYCLNCFKMSYHGLHSFLSLPGELRNAVYDRACAQAAELNRDLLRNIIPVLPNTYLLALEGNPPSEALGLRKIERLLREARSTEDYFRGRDITLVKTEGQFWLRPLLDIGRYREFGICANFFTLSRILGDKDVTDHRDLTLMFASHQTFAEMSPMLIDKLRMTAPSVSKVCEFGITVPLFARSLRTLEIMQGERLFHVQAKHWFKVLFEIFPNLQSLTVANVPFSNRQSTTIPDSEHDSQPVWHMVHAERPGTNEDGAQLRLNLGSDHG